jgi:hypothetical protein
MSELKDMIAESFDDEQGGTAPLYIPHISGNSLSPNQSNRG